MNKLKLGLILVSIFILSVFVAFRFEDSYRKIIRNLYTSLSNNKISFFLPKKDFHFPSDVFLISFGLFVTLLYFFINRQTRRQKIINGMLAIFILISSIIFQCYFDGVSRLAECTVCNDGTIRLRYSDINYDLIFISSLILSLLPAAITGLINFIKTKAKGRN